MNIKITEENDLAIISLSGRMDAVTTQEYDSALKTLLDSGKSKAILDLAELEYISSAGLRSILGTLKSLKAKNGKLAFCNLQAMVVEVFRISGFTAMLSIYNTLDEAIVATK